MKTVFFYQSELRQMFSVGTFSLILTRLSSRPPQTSVNLSAGHGGSSVLPSRALLANILRPGCQINALNKTQWVYVEWRIKSSNANDPDKGKVKPVQWRTASPGRGNVGVSVLHTLLFTKTLILAGSKSAQGVWLFSSHEKDLVSWRRSVAHKTQNPQPAHNLNQVAITFWRRCVTNESITFSSVLWFYKCLRSLQAGVINMAFWHNISNICSLEVMMRKTELQSAGEGVKTPLVSCTWHAWEQLEIR